jgi:tetratricopeptide (TPR) repeat protein
MNSWVRLAIPGALIVLFVFLAYLPALRGGFIWDDDFYVTNNPLLTAPDGLRRIWFSTDSPSQYFPLTYTVFRIEHALWGLNPAGYHWVNVLLHAFNALLVWRLLKRLSVPGAWLAAAIFALHPVMVESVAWITELKSILSLFFILLTLYCWIEFVGERSRRFWYGLALVFYALALFSKTTACTLPAALLLILWLKRKAIDWRRLAQVVPFLAMGLGMGLLTMWWERFHQGTQGKLFSMGWLERILVASHALWFYAGKLFWPVNLTFIYPRWTINPADPSAYGWLLMGIGLGAAIYFTRRFFGRGVEVAALFYAATLSPLLGFVMVYTFRYTFVADHYQYVASIGLIALAAAGITLAFKARPFLKLACCGALLLTLGILTWRQCGMYADIETLWRTTIAKNSNAFLAYNNLGTILSDKGQMDAAIADFQKTLEINPDFAEAHNNLGNALLRKGQVDEAMDHFKKVVEIAPDSAVSHCNLGNALLRMGQLDGAMVQFRKALEIQTDYAEAHNNLGIVLLRKGQPDEEAMIQFQKALESNPDYSEAHYNLGAVFGVLGRLDEAVGQYRKAIQLKPDYADAHGNLANVLATQGKFDEAIPEYRRTLELVPKSAQAHFRFGQALQGERNFEAAIQEYQKALDLVPQHLSAHLGLAWLLATCPEASLRNGQKAVELAQQAERLGGGESPQILDTLAAAYAEAGRFGEAVETARQALSLSAAKNNKPLAEAIQTRLKLYETRSAYHEKP